jgi:hypothetical protein
MDATSRPDIATRGPVKDMGKKSGRERGVR